MISKRYTGTGLGHRFTTGFSSISGLFSPCYNYTCSVTSILCISCLTPYLFLGPGIYMAVDGATALFYAGYGHVGSGWQHSQFGASVKCIALCEIVTYGDLDPKHCNGDPVPILWSCLFHTCYWCCFILTCWSLGATILNYHHGCV